MRMLQVQMLIGTAFLLELALERRLREQTLTEMAFLKGMLSVLEKRLMEMVGLLALQLDLDGDC